MGSARAPSVDPKSSRDDTKLLHHGDTVELRPDVRHATVIEAIEVHAFDPDLLTGRGNPHKVLLERTGYDPSGGDGVAAGDDVLQVLHQVGKIALKPATFCLNPANVGS
jgi:hypothetical protein